MIAEWTEKPWNPVTGCTKISSGCQNCYAEQLANGFLKRMRNVRYQNGFNVTLQEDLLDEPLKWKKPQRIFTCSMSDLFHADIPDEYILRVFDTMRRASQHTFLVLTKRANRLEAIAKLIEWADNIWMGVTVEEERYADRIRMLQGTPARHKFVCAEPLLSSLGELNLTDIEWIFVGGESGPGARPMEESWVLELRDQCSAQGVTFTFKQWGGVRRRKNGSLLQGQHYHEMPPVMRD
ncbi:MAG TPA: phage Gp37/Gp68 family protein [Bacteroidales bacterium]|nr:phage Gp37/Gp68 family protein [Bacteroidales bacterium]